jgi:cell division protein FtsZ
VLRQAIQGISDLILVPGLINLDFADVKTIMSAWARDHGHRHGRGRERAMLAANARSRARCSRTRRCVGARGVIINVTGGPDMSLIEVSEPGHHPGRARVIFGAVVDPACGA